MPPKRRSQKTNRKYNKYNKKSHLTFDKKIMNQDNMSHKKTENMKKRLDDAAEAVSRLPFNQSSLQEKYAHDIVALSVLHGLLTHAKRNGENDEQNAAQDAINKYAENEEKMLENLEKYNEFKLACRELQMVEVKISENDNEKESPYLKKRKRELQDTIEEKAQAIHFGNDETGLITFKDSSQLIRFLEQIESENFITAYREKITDLDIINDIKNTPAKELAELAERRLNDSTFDIESAETQVKEGVQTIDNEITSISPVQNMVLS